MLLDALILILPLAGIAFGWMARADQSLKEQDRAYYRGYADAIRGIEEKAR
jgi:hypothetical protein